jgi:DNA-binding CsgD family transcriptional regulator/PAS domain-containing protein
MGADPAGLLPILYEAPTNQGRWREFLERLCQQLAAKSAVLVVQGQQRCTLESHCGLDPETHRQYQSYYGAIDTFYAYARQRGFNHPGLVVPAQAFVSERELSKTEYCNDFLLKFDILQHCFALLDTGSAAPTVLTLMRGRRDSSFDERELRVLRFLAPHVQSAIQLHNRIQGLERKAGAVIGALDHLEQGVVLLDANGRVLLINQAAVEIFASERNLRVTSRGLLAAVPSENKRLSALIHGAIATTNGEGSHPGGAMIVSRRAVRHPLQVLVTPLRTQTIHLDKERPVVAIFISDPDHKSAPDSAILAQLYRLTPAECRLAQMLTTGETLKAAAERLGVAQSTVRSQLKSIFAKTDTSRQSELVRILLTSPNRAARE